VPCRSRKIRFGSLKKVESPTSATKFQQVAPSEPSSSRRHKKERTRKLQKGIKIKKKNVIIIVSKNKKRIKENIQGK
jgi:hypothetical protein